MLKKIGKNKLQLLQILLMAILIFGAFLRLFHIDQYMTFLGDEGRDVLVVKRMIVDHKLTLLGPTASVGGFFLGPAYYYFMLPFLWLFQLNPVGPAVMVALFAVATIYLLFRVIEDFSKSQFAALAGAFLYAISPLVIAQSRSSWNPNLLPFFSLLLIYALYKGVTKENNRWFFLAGLAIGIGLQLHYLFTFLMPVATIFMLIYQHKLKSLKFYGGILSGFLVGLSPFLAFELRHSFPNTRSILKFILAKDEVRYLGYEVTKILSDVLFRLFARLVFLFPNPDRFAVYGETKVFFWQWAVMAVLTLSLLALGWRLYKRREKSTVLLLLWLVFGVGLFAFYHRGIYDYYFGIMFALPFILTVLAGKTFWSLKVLRPVIILLFVGLVVLNLSGIPFRYAPNNQLRQVREAARFVFEKAENKPFNFALITTGNSDHGYRYFLEIWGNKPVVIENFAADPGRQSVTDQLLVICEVQNCRPLGDSLWEVAGFGRAEIAGDWRQGFLEIFKLVHYSEPAAK